MENLNTIKVNLKQHQGGGQMFHNRINTSSLYTEGIKDLLTQANCYWLYDIIQTEVFAALKKLNNPDTHYFTIKSTANVGELDLQDYKKNVIWSRAIEYTDFPAGAFEFIIGWDGQQMISCLHNEN